MVRQLWAEIQDFPGYEVSDWGNIVNLETGHFLTPVKNQHGVMNVGLMQKGIQRKRAVSRLVAMAFLEPPRDPRFNALIHRDGNREHNFAANLEWRPRAFVHMYYAQFREPYPNRINKQIVNRTTGDLFSNTIEAAVHYGVLERAIVMSILNENEPVFPTGDVFDVV